MKISNIRFHILILTQRKCNSNMTCGLENVQYVCEPSVDESGAQADNTQCSASLSYLCANYTVLDFLHSIRKIMHRACSFVYRASSALMFRQTSAARYSRSRILINIWHSHVFEWMPLSCVRTEARTQRLRTHTHSSLVCTRANACRGGIKVKRWYLRFRYDDIWNDAPKKKQQKHKQHFA